MSTRFMLWFVSALTVLVASCGGRRDGREALTVPRPVAYPRIEMPDSSYVPVVVGVDTLLINAGARGETASRDGGVWVDVLYDAPFSPRLALTLTDARGRVDEVLANRSERMALNLGGARCEMTDITTPGGWTCRMALARSVAATPIQLLATDGTHVLSGALVLEVADSVAADPVAYAPVVEAVKRDVLVMLRSMR